VKSKPFSDPEAFARIRRVPPQPVQALERAREEVAARGVDVVDLSTFAADAPLPAAVLERLGSAASDPRLRRTVDPRGLAELRAAAARFCERRRGVQVDPEREVLVTMGAREGIGHALLALLSEGDAVLVPAPTDPAHVYGAVIAGAEPLPVAVGAGVDFFDSIVAATERADRRAKGIVVNFPANPTAAIATPELLEKIVRFAEARGMFVLSDASAADLVLDGAPAPSILAVAGATERVLEFMSVSEACEMPGWPVGFCAGNAALTAAVSRVKSILGEGPFGPAQAAAATALDLCDAGMERIRERYRARREALVRAFAAAGWNVPAPAAAPYAWAALPDSVRSLGSLEVARRLLEEGVAVSPGVAYGPAGEGSCRIALVADEPRIELAAERVARVMRRGGK
jgi:alanine-synthesizing transaminase